MFYSPWGCIFPQFLPLPGASLVQFVHCSASCSLRLFSRLQHHHFSYLLFFLFFKFIAREHLTLLIAHKCATPLTNYLSVCPQRVLEELEDISLRVDNVKDQAIILMTSRGPACRDVVEPKLDELNCNFDKVSQHIRTAQVQQQKLKILLSQKLSNSHY